MLPDSNTKSIETSENHAKKRPRATTSRNPQKVKECIEEIKDIPKEKIVYVDETGIDKFMYRKYARAVKGEKVYGKIIKT